ncbi:hypothetical protein ACFQPG_10915 [Sphingomonas sp. GCM10030256]|uniref:hypothetical protein n=1 Tax=Sphingomonas sp. GCM10030256 TaxID=3273427 RepID=UPI00360B7BED
MRRLREANHLPYVVDQTAADDHSRLVLVAIAGLNLRMMENWRTTQLKDWAYSLDYESTMITLAIIVIRSQRAMRTPPDLRLHDLKNKIPEELSTKCNVSSIAAATGINRETVRRKVRRLQALGLVAQHDDGGVMIPIEALGSENMSELLRSQLDALRVTFDQLTRSGILRHSRGSTV